MEYNKLYNRIFEIIGDETPLKADCGKVCDGACCKGDENTGMLLFPNEEAQMNVKITRDGKRLLVCNGTCDRLRRPLACRIFPFMIAVNEKNKAQIILDPRGYGVCPLIQMHRMVKFNKKFISRLKKAAKLLIKDEEILKFLKEQTDEAQQISKFLK